jgi:hypothetical protein
VADKTDLYIKLELALAKAKAMKPDEEGLKYFTQVLNGVTSTESIKSS